MYQEDFHLIFNSFSTKLKALRNAYGISFRETATILNISARSVVFEWENKKKFPSGENLNMISTVFGVPIDWLLGHTETLYFNDSITWTEKHLHIPHENISPGTSQDLLWNLYLHEHYPEYANPQKRIQYYSLPVRANIAVLMYQVRLTSLYWRMYYIQNGFKKRGVMAEVKHFFHIPKEEVVKPPNRKELERCDNLVRLLKLSRINGHLMMNKMPIYDVETTYNSLKNDSAHP